MQTAKAFVHCGSVAHEKQAANRELDCAVVTALIRLLRTHETETECSDATSKLLADQKQALDACSPEVHFSDFDGVNNDDDTGDCRADHQINDAQPIDASRLASGTTTTKATLVASKNGYENLAAMKLQATRCTT